MEQWTGSKLEKEYIKAVYCHPAYLTYMHSTSWETLGWMDHRLESSLPGEICRWYHFNGRKWRGTKEPLDEGEREEWKSQLKIQHSKNKECGIQSHHFTANRWEKVETVTDFIFLGSKITVDSDYSHGLKEACCSVTNLDRVLKSRDITLLTKVCIVKAMDFPWVMYGCQSWIIKKAECQSIDAFELGCWRRLLKVPWTARRSK